MVIAAVRPYPAMMHAPVLFLDAEGTLWRPRKDRTAQMYWDDPSIVMAEEVFEREPGVVAMLGRLREKGWHTVVLSIHVPVHLRDLLQHFGYDAYVDEVIVRPHPIEDTKLDWAKDYLKRHGLEGTRCLMVGDSVKYDVEPFVEAGWNALLVSREYNRRAGVEGSDGLQVFEEQLVE